MIVFNKIENFKIKFIINVNIFIKIILIFILITAAVF